MHDPCLFNRVSLAEYLLYSGCFLKLVAGEPEVVFGHFYSADPNAGKEYDVVAVVMSLSKASLL